MCDDPQKNVPLPVKRAWRMEAGALLLGAIALSLASNGWFGTRVGAVSRANELAFTPRDGAFAIWGVIYPLLCFHAAAQWRSGGGGASSASAALLSASLGAAALWVPLFVQNSPAPAAAAALVLQAGFGCAYAACYLSPRGTTVAAWATIDLPLGVYAGWVLVAAFLTTCIALRLRGWSLADWLPALAAAGGAVGAVAARSPECALAQLWAFAWSPGPWAPACRAISSLGAAGAVARLLGRRLLPL